MRALACSFLLLAALPAQVARDSWVVSTFTDTISSQTPGGLWVVDAARTAATKLSGQTANMVAANCVVADENGLVFYGTLRSASVPVPNPGEILRVIVAGTAVATETVLTGGSIDTGSVSGLALRGDQIWFVTDAGNVGWIPKAVGSPTFALNINTQGVRGLGQSIATNGREIFVGSSHSNSNPDPANVWFFDAESAAPTLTGIAFLNGSAFAMSLGRDNRALVGRISGQLWYADHVTLSATQLNAGATAPQGNCNGTAINPWHDVVGNAPGFGTSTRLLGFYDVATNTWPVTLNLDLAIPSGVASAHEEPFFLFGSGCTAPNGVEPRLSWTGIPQQGQGFTLTLRDAQVGAALLLVGFSDQVGPLGPLPLDLGPFGAPGCFLRVSAEAIFAHVVTTGTAAQAFAVPAIPALAGLRLHGQWGVFGSSTTVTEGVHITLR